MNFQILINSKPQQIGDPLPDKITHLNIINNTHPLFVQLLKPGKVLSVKKWLNEVIDRLELEDGYATYNELVVNQEDLNKFPL